MRKGKIIKRAMILYMLAALPLGGCGTEGFPEEEIETIEAEDIPAKKIPKEEKQEQNAETESDGNDSQGIPEEEGKQNVSGEAANQTQQDTEKENAPESAQKDGESARLQKYRAVLTDVLEKQIYPDGADCGFDGFYPVSDNRFAVIDVDKDGKKELILCITTTSMAGMREVVYDYDEKADALREEYSGFPDMVFYDNGLVEEGFSHNQGMASSGDFWPYFLYQYQAESDKYQCVFVVDAWEKECREKDYNGTPYPEEIDQEKSGIVYFVMEEGNYDFSATEPICKSDYEKWRKDQGLESTKTEIPFQALTAENIGKI